MVTGIYSVDGLYSCWGWHVHTLGMWRRFHVAVLNLILTGCLSKTGTLGRDSKLRSYRIQSSLLVVLLLLLGAERKLSLLLRSSSADDVTHAHQEELSASFKSLPIITL